MILNGILFPAIAKTFPSYVHTRIAFTHVSDIHTANYDRRLFKLDCLSRACTSVASNHMHRMSMRRCSTPRACNANKIQPSSHIQINHTHIFSCIISPENEITEVINLHYILQNIFMQNYVSGKAYIEIDRLIHVDTIHSYQFQFSKQD